MVTYCGFVGEFRGGGPHEASRMPGICLFSSVIPSGVRSAFSSAPLALAERDSNL
jgi:hypothetical protein